MRVAAGAGVEVTTAAEGRASDRPEAVAEVEVEVAADAPGPFWVSPAGGHASVDALRARGTSVKARRRVTPLVLAVRARADKKQKGRAACRRPFVCHVS